MPPPKESPGKSKKSLSTKSIPISKSKKLKKAYQSSKTSPKSQIPPISKLSAKPVTHVDRENGAYSCTICNAKFNGSPALGGHISKAHPGGSLLYKQKQQRRKEREGARDLLRRAKAFYLSNHFDQVDKLSKGRFGYRRSVLEKIKKDLLAGPCSVAK